MTSLNKVSLIGNLGRDPEIKFFPDRTKLLHIKFSYYRKMEG